MRQIKPAIAAIALLLPAATFADSNIAADLATCAALQDTSERLQCYDEMSRRYAVTTDESGNAARPPDTLGAEQLAGRKDKRDEAASQHVFVRAIRCEKGPRDKYYFYLEGGQVWKQVSDKRLSYKDCDFNVTISKDFFGYKMQVEGEKAKTRISRIR